MAGAQRRKCKCCHKLFRPDPRNRHHQRYCPAASCRPASKRLPGDARSESLFAPARSGPRYRRGELSEASR
jgi:hypothetical protein